MNGAVIPLQTFKLRLYVDIIMRYRFVNEQIQSLAGREHVVAEAFSYFLLCVFLVHNWPFKSGLHS